MIKPKKNNGRFYEETVFRIYNSLEPYADVRINDKIVGRDTGVERQIDVSIRAKIADHEILIIIQVKDHKTPADIKIVGEFSSVIKDVGAQKGIIVCKSGFTKTAITQARNLKIDLLSAHDAISDSIIVNYKFPTVKETIQIDWKEFKVEVDEIVKGKLVDGQMWSEDLLRRFFSLSLITKQLGKTTLLNQFYQQWDTNKGGTNQEKYSFSFQGGMLEYNQQRFQISDFQLNFTIKRNFFLKFVPIFEYKLVRNYISESEKAITTFSGEPFPFLNDGTWEKIENPNLIAINSPSLHLEIFDFTLNIFRRFNFCKELNMLQKRNYDLKLISGRKIN